MARPLIISGRVSFIIYCCPIILINKKGNVVDGNFMRPSSEEDIYKYLTSLKGM